MVSEHEGASEKVAGCTFSEVPYNHFMAGNENQESCSIGRGGVGREHRVREIGHELLHRAREFERQRSPFQQWLDTLIRRMAEDQAFRVQALRFIDVLPSLEDDAALTRHLREYFTADEFPLPDMVKWGIEHSRSAAASHLLAPLLREMVRRIGRQYIAGKTTDEASKVIERLHRHGKRVSLDLLGEVVLSEKEAEAYQQAYQDLIGLLGQSCAQRGEPLHLSLKVSSLDSQIVPQAPGVASRRIRERLRPIADAVMRMQGGLTLDMEHYDYRHVTLRVFRDLLSETEFATWSGCGIAIQAYLKEALQDLRQLLEWNSCRAAGIAVRLVRGAYWDMETTIARREGWPVPVWESKEETDASYERCLELLMRHHEHVRPLVATHNVRSIALALALVEEFGLTSGEYEFQMLYGMAEGLQAALVEMGQPLRIYLPIGPVIPGMAYLVRRFLENSSNTSFLLRAFSEQWPEEELLAGRRMR